MTSLLAAACKFASNEAAAEHFAAIERFALLLFVLSVVVAVGAAGFVVVTKRKPIAIVPLAVLVALHPHNWLGVRSGDCGTLLKILSIVATVLVCLVAFAIAAKPRTASRR